MGGCLLSFFVYVIFNLELHDFFVMCFFVIFKNLFDLLFT